MFQRIIADLVKFEQQGAVAGGEPPAEFGRFVHSEVLRWRKVVIDAGINIDN